MRLLKIISKNFKLLIRSRSSALIVVLGPLLIIFLVGLAFDTSGMYNINIGVYSSEYNDLTNSFVNNLNEKEFKVTKYSTEESCTDAIKKGDSNACMVFPPNMVIGPDIQNEIVFYVDNSKINLVWMILDTLSSKLSSRSKEISMNLTEMLISKLQETRSEIFSKKSLASENQADSQQVADSLISIKTGLDSLNLTFNAEDFKLANLTNTTDLIKSEEDNLKTNLLALADSADVEIGTVKNEINALNISSSNKEDMIDELNIAQNAITMITENITSSKTLTDSDYNLTKTLLNEANVKLIDVKAKLDTIASTRDTVSQNIDAMKTKLNANVERAKQLLEMMDKIDKNIESLKITDAKSVVSPITTTIKPVSTEKSRLNYLFPSLVVLVVMFISILLTTSLILMEKNSPAYFRNFITPTRDITFTLAIFLTTLIIVLLQLTVIMGVSAYVFKAQIITNIWPLLLALLAITTIFILVGMIIGYFFNSEETATLAAISTGSIFLLISNLVLPLESMPRYIIEIAQYNPFVIGEGLVRKIILFSPTIQQIWWELALLGIYSAALMIIIWVFEIKLKKHFFHRLKHMKKEKEIEKKEVVKEIKLIDKELKTDKSEVKKTEEKSKKDKSDKKK